MKTYTYHHELRIILAQILNAFDSLIIKRLNEQDDISNIDDIEVSLVYAPKQRVLHDIVNKSQHIKIPTIAITMQNLSYDKTRAFNKIEPHQVAEIYAPNGLDIPQPIPINITLNMSILTRYSRDLDQILTCLFVNLFPYLMISYEHPYIKHEVRSKVEWNGNISLQYPIDITATQPYRIIADTSFTVQGWFFKNCYNNSGIIHNIPVSFSAVSALYDDYDAMHAMESPLTTDYLEVSGRPFIHSVEPYRIMAEDVGKSLSIKGNMFDYLSGVALSGISSDVFATSAYQTFNPYISSHRLSSIYTAFDAVSVEYTKIDNNNLTFILPQIQNSGHFDIIGWGLAGLGKLTEDSYINGSSIQWPYVSGVEII